MAIDDRWMQDAACREVENPDQVFFPPTKKGIKADTRQAKAVCSICHVRPTCLVYAVVHHENRGVWGGLTEGERRAIPTVTKRKFRQLWFTIYPNAHRRNYVVGRR